MRKISKLAFEEKEESEKPACPAERRTITYNNNVNTDKVPILKNYLCVYFQLHYNCAIMRKHIIISVLFISFSLFGCAANPNKARTDMEQKVNESSRINRALEKRIDDLSVSVSLLVSDGNRIHNKIDDLASHIINSQQNLQKSSAAIQNIDERLNKLETGYKTLEGNLNKQIIDIQQAKVELSNLQKMTKEGIRNAFETQEESNDVR